METAKVDIRKLQLLNDRINQCIDALTQVRLSVHGLAPTSIQPGTNPAIGSVAGLSHTTGAQVPFGPVGFTNPMSLYNTGFGAVPYPGIPSSSFPGFSHTSAFAPSFALAAGLQPMGAPFGLEALESQQRSAWGDPLLAARIVQTFPYAQLPVPPVVTIY